MMRLINSLKTEAALYLDRLRRSSLYSPPLVDGDDERHLRQAVEWLMRAQDAGTDRGVAYGVDFGGPFLDSYPETTGYIIPTFLKLADYYGDDAFNRRAVEMGEWESEIQMECGAVMGGRLNSNPTPAVFNTGMVLLGWSALQQRFPRESFHRSLRRAADWLVGVQEPDGSWRKGNSHFANPEATVYNVKAAWGLCEAGRVAGMPDAISAAIRNAEHCQRKQTGNGWYQDCCLTDASQPLLHTIAYTMQGLIGIGVAVQRPDFIETARRTADALADLMDDSGFIPGCIDSRFRGAVEWCCLTGTAQTAIVWARLFQLTGRPAYREAMERANRYLMRHHDIDNSDPRIRGGMPGSWPVWGDYGRMKILNWATNFFVEALLLQNDIHRDAGEKQAAKVS